MAALWSPRSAVGLHIGARLRPVSQVSMSFKFSIRPRVGGTGKFPQKLGWTNLVSITVLEA